MGVPRMRHVAMIAILAVAPALLASWPSVACAAPPPPTDRYTVKNSATTPGRTAQRPTAAGETTKRAAEKPQVTTMINVQLLTGDEGNGLTAFRWQQVFQKLDVMLTIRQARSDDKPSVTERKSGGVRQIDVIGRLDRKGQVIFPERTFTSSDTSKLSEWLDELKVYGAQGSPAGQSAWGL